MSKIMIYFIVWMLGVIYGAVSQNVPWWGMIISALISCILSRIVIEIWDKR